jgi:hypothetical protein
MTTSGQLPRVRFGGEVFGAQRVHVGAGTLLPCLSIQQAERTATCELSDHRFTVCAESKA